jgi:hypothetical protein
MSSILLPSTLLNSGGFGIDLNRSLLGLGGVAARYINGIGIDFASGRRFRLNNSPVEQHKIWGSYISNGYQFEIPAAIWSMTRAWSLFFYARITSINTGTKNLFSVSGYDAGTIFSLKHANWSRTISALEQVAWTAYTASITAPDGEWVPIMWVHAPCNSGNASTLYVGDQIASYTASGTPAGTSAGNIIVNIGGGQDSVTAPILFDRLLSNAEYAFLSKSMAPVFRNKSLIYFDMGAAGGGASTGTLSATQSGDSLTGAAQLVLSATLSAAQDSNTLTGQAALALSGALSIAQASDSLAANGTVASTAITGTLTAAQGANTLSAQGALPIIGTLSASQASNTITTQGVLAIGASLSATQSVNTITAQAALALSGTLSATQVSDTLIANGTSTHSGDLSVTQTGNTLSGLGALSLSGYLAATQADNTLSASAVLAIVGSMSTAQAADVLIATGARDLFGTLAAVQADQALTATGTSVAGLTDSQKIDLILKILSDRQTLDPTTGLYTLYDTDATTVLYTASAWEDTGGTIPYRGQQLQRLDPLT